MPRFIITTWEDVEGLYSVEAEDRAAAEAMFGDPRINWDQVEQLDYMAFSVEVKTVTEVTLDNPEKS